MQKRSSTIGSTTYQKIKQDIILGNLAPSSKLKLDALKAQYSASLSTLRETLNRLASEGFVTAEEQRGFFVTAVSKEDLTEITDLRVLLECSAMKTSIESGDTNWEGDLVAAHHKLHTEEKKLMAGDLSVKSNWKRYDKEFHLALIQSCHSKNLLSLHATIYDKYLRYQILVLTYRGEEAVNEHRHMFEAALNRDTDKACAELEKHIRLGLEHTLEAMNKEP